MLEYKLLKLGFLNIKIGLSIQIKLGNKTQKAISLFKTTLTLIILSKLNFKKKPNINKALIGFVDDFNTNLKDKS